ncbi:MAG: hypothetical protein QMD04_06135 [Anaerolineales bacterium]|nr:hypothetical protein [Anaerolineales bacterium]
MKRSRWIWKTTVLALALVVLAALLARPAAADDEFPQKNAWTRATPSVVRVDAAEQGQGEDFRQVDHWNLSEEYQASPNSLSGMWTGFSLPNSSERW